MKAWCPYCAAELQEGKLWCNDDCKKGNTRAIRFIRKHYPSAKEGTFGRKEGDVNPLGPVGFYLQDTPGVTLGGRNR